MTMDCSPRLVRVTLMENAEGSTVASVALAIGPVTVFAFIVKGENRLFLSMPGRHNESRGRWYDHVKINDPGIRYEAERLAIQAYQDALSVAA